MTIRTTLTPPIVLLTASLMVGSGHCRAELIVNGDFEAGATGFSTDYDLGPPFAQGSYQIASFFPDHTTGSGLLFAANGEAGILAWGQSVAVQQDADYTLSLWAQNWPGSGNHANLDIRVGGSSIGSITPTAGVWENFSAVINSGVSTSLDIEIIDLTGAASGNDFMLDDISFTFLASTAPVPEPTSLAIWSLLSVVGAGYSWQRRRKRAA